MQNLSQMSENKVRALLMTAASRCLPGNYLNESLVLIFEFCSLISVPLIRPVFLRSFIEGWTANSFWSILGGERSGETRDAELFCIISSECGREPSDLRGGERSWSGDGVWCRLCLWCGGDKSAFFLSFGESDTYLALWFLGGNIPALSLEGSSLW